MITVLPVEGMPEVRPGDEIAELIASHADLQEGDVVVVTQKIVSKAEGRLEKVADDEERLRLIERESVRVLRRRDELVISETRQGFVCANAGVDLSNVDDGIAALLPVDADRSARHIRDALGARTGVTVAVVVSDTFGRPWRRGLVDVALGCAGVAAIVDLRGTEDTRGRTLQATEVAIADELSSAAELVMGKDRDVPVAVVRGLDPSWLRESSVRTEIVRPHNEDLFR
ncbi:MAG TPA: coenzyme F420-0:L-glutamate ligase [Acidimicrobiales bacterium]|nr:coenzyme F420-0:L-glutamate ligase [Acidimicrobiales bacterium]